jgi:hypothetical protein
LKSVALPLALLSAALIAVAQSPAPKTAVPHAHPPAPKPTNLQVLPKTMTGEQVHELMHQWEDELGTECSTCHTADPKNLAPNGKPRLNFADDSKPEKATARQMVRMVEAINVEYISKIPNSDMPVTCGTCHRGKLSPAPFAAKDEEHEHKEPPPASERPKLPR